MLCWLGITHEHDISILSRYSHSFTCSSHWPGPSGRPHSWSPDVEQATHPIAPDPCMPPHRSSSTGRKPGGISTPADTIVRLRSRSPSVAPSLFLSLDSIIISTTVALCVVSNVFGTPGCAQAIQTNRTLIQLELYPTSSVGIGRHIAVSQWGWLSTRPSVEMQK